MSKSDKKSNKQSKGKKTETTKQLEATNYILDMGLRKYKFTDAADEIYAMAEQGKYGDITKGLYKTIDSIKENKPKLDSTEYQTAVLFYKTARLMMKQGVITDFDLTKYHKFFEIDSSGKSKPKSEKAKPKDTPKEQEVVGVKKVSRKAKKPKKEKPEEEIPEEVLGIQTVTIEYDSPASFAKGMADVLDHGSEYFSTTDTEFELYREKIVEMLKPTVDQFSGLSEIANGKNNDRIETSFTGDDPSKDAKTGVSILALGFRGYKTKSLKERNKYIDKSVEELKLLFEEMETETAIEGGPRRNIVVYRGKPKLVKQPATPEEQPATPEEQPATPEEQPPTSEEQQSASDEMAGFMKKAKDDLEAEKKAE